MKTALMAGAALVVQSFSPLALPGQVRVAAAQATPNVLLCNDNQLLGGAGSGQYWGTPYILPYSVKMTTTFTGPFDSGTTEYYLAKRTIQLAPLLQRCPVLGKNGQPTGKHQDVRLSEADTFIQEFKCQPNLTTDGLQAGYKYCNNPELAGSSGDDR